MKLSIRKYYNQLDKLKAAIAKKWSELANRRNHYDNAKPYIALTVREKQSQFGWDILSYLLYSSDLALSDYYLFLLLKNSFHDKWLQSVSEIKTSRNILQINPNNFGKKE